MLPAQVCALLYQGAELCPWCATWGSTPIVSASTVTWVGFGRRRSSGTRAAGTVEQTGQDPPLPTLLGVQGYNTQEDWLKWETQAWEQTTRRPKKQPAWPPGLGWGRAQLTPGEYEEAVASLWKDADPQAQQVLRACGICLQCFVCSLTW